MQPGTTMKPHGSYVHDGPATEEERDLIERIASLKAQHEQEIGVLVARLEECRKGRAPRYVDQAQYVPAAPDGPAG